MPGIKESIPGNGVAGLHYYITVSKHPCPETGPLMFHLKGVRKHLNPNEVYNSP